MSYTFSRDFTMDPYDPYDEEMRAKKVALTHALLETVRLVLGDEPESDEDRHTSSPMCRPASRRTTAVSQRTALLTSDDSPREEDSSQDEPCDALHQAFAKRRVQPSPKGGVPGGPCAHCGATESPQWRRPLTKKVILCNACGIYYSRHHAMPKRKKVPSSSRRPISACGLELQIDSMDEEGVDEAQHHTHMLKRSPQEHVLLLSDVLRPPKRSHLMMTGLPQLPADPAAAMLHPPPYANARSWAALPHLGGSLVEDEGVEAVRVQQQQRQQYEVVVAASTTTVSHSSGSVLEGDDHFADSNTAPRGCGRAAAVQQQVEQQQQRYNAPSLVDTVVQSGHGGGSGFVKLCAGDVPSAAVRRHHPHAVVTSALEPVRLLPERLATLSGVSQHRLQHRLQQAASAVPVLQDLLPPSAAAYAATWTPLMRENTARVVAAAASFKAAEASKAAAAQQQQLLRAEAQQANNACNVMYTGNQSNHSSPAHASSQSHMTTSLPRQLPPHSPSPRTNHNNNAQGAQQQQQQQRPSSAATTKSSAEHSADSRPTSLVLIPVCASMGPKRAAAAGGGGRSRGSTPVPNLPALMH